MKKYLISPLKIVLALLVFCGPVRAQTPVVIQNPSFETFAPMTGSVVGMGAWNNGPIPGWTVSGGGGSFQPTEFAALPNGVTVAYSNGGTISQNLGVPLQPNVIYTLTVWVAHRVDSAGDMANTYTLALNAGTTNLCAFSGNSKTIPAGTFAAQTLTCPTGATVPAGNLTIALSAGGIQIDFDKVSLSSAPAILPPPPTHQAVLTWTDTTNPGGTRYNVYRTSPACPPPPYMPANFQLIAPDVTTLSYTDTGLQAATSYCYGVSAVDSTGQQGIMGVLLFIPGSVTTITVQ